MKKNNSNENNVGYKKTDFGYKPASNNRNIIDRGHQPSTSKPVKPPTPPTGSSAPDA